MMVYLINGSECSARLENAAPLAAGLCGADISCHPSVHGDAPTVRAHGRGVSCALTHTIAGVADRSHSNLTVRCRRNATKVDRRCIVADAKGAA
ncbi:hypothetical protein EVAR_8449_1 [Eumeta japonica]|uniref:Uncharacterized protein n=1 Tax=Eumeta variegata TaxID=151549 RepID=A0A4C1WCN5_EUMVA|nr:hypothetical protein EVAR_8449_1 [Eumeta japonica]